MISSCELSSSNAASRLRRLETLLSEQEESTRILVDLAKLSDRAKSLVYRDGEIEAMREAVHHDLMKQDYDAAEELINSFEGQPGCARESARLRAVLAASRKGTLDEQIEAAIKHVQEKIGSRDWAQAKRQADRLTKLFPGRPMVSALSEQIQTARARHKRDLLQAYGQAVEKRDIDGGITLLKELDTYLTPQEAAALEESARGVFKARLLNYGVQFSICVTDKNWAKAVAVGEQIIEAYPNSRMAQEVNEKMDLLRTHAYAAVEAVKLQQAGSPAEAGAEA